VKVKTPRFVTFTGVDEHTPIEGMAALSKRYPIEWGVLFSPSRQGSGRYPPLNFVGRLIHSGHLMRLSAHLCGGHSRDVIQRGASDVDGFVADGFERAQINSADTSIDAHRVLAWADQVEVMPILQCRGDGFPVATNVRWLFDESGGRGIAPTRWPQGHATATCGYAGGITPENVKDAVAAMPAVDFWIDMESGVRDEADRFSLERCLAVCEALYGEGW
jgi:hypothetical protein